jgi:hypothetical protein
MIPRQTDQLCISCGGATLRSHQTEILIEENSFELVLLAQFRYSPVRLRRAFGDIMLVPDIA